ncbi:MAG: hypothetical protein LBN26_01785 [Christensenellaceae bacterium]|jgi:hypothetical protein|nr:hypothetical protein [Christensenellaceae bacterium]
MLEKIHTIRKRKQKSKSDKKCNFEIFTIRSPGIEEMAVVIFYPKVFFWKAKKSINMRQGGGGNSKNHIPVERKEKNSIIPWFFRQAKTAGTACGNRSKNNRNTKN